MNAVHRLVEQRASEKGEAAAIVAGTRAITYRELNSRGNTLARVLCESGLRRGELAIVTMPRGIDVAVVLLAVLKAGACYAWIEPGTDSDVDLPTGLCIVQRSAEQDQQFIVLDLEQALREASRPSPNLPVLTRASDVACVLPDARGRAHVVVPHATITALPMLQGARGAAWEGTAGALDLWVALMSGVTLSVGAAESVTAAA